MKLGKKWNHKLGGKLGGRLRQGVGESRKKKSDHFRGHVMLRVGRERVGERE